jgi:hypothetical protein
MMRFQSERNLVEQEVAVCAVLNNAVIGLLT